MKTASMYPLAKSGQRCSVCEVDIPLSVPGDIEDVVLLQVVSAVVRRGTLYCKIEVADDHDYLFAPHFFCPSCWEQLVEDLQEASKECEEHASIYYSDGVVRCDYCNSGIGEKELYASICSGGLHPSPRTPCGLPEVDFIATKKMERPEVLCIGCMKLIDSEVVELWSSDVSQGDECDKGTYRRCWRYAKCPGCLIR